MAIPLTKKPLFTSTCKICGAGASLFDVVDFNKFCSQADPYLLGLSGIPIYYARCSACDFIFTEHFDDWSPDQFADMIYNDQYILVDGEYASARPIRMAEHFAAKFPRAAACSILDYGSGSGIFVNALKERGFNDVAGYDPFSTPNRPDGRFDVITCCEVIEHSPDPRASLQDMLSFAKPDTAIVFTTLIQPPSIDSERANHWYIAPRNGHISIFSRKSMKILAESLGLMFVPGAGAFHMLVPPISALDPPPGALPFASKVVGAPQANSEGWQASQKSEDGDYRWTGREALSWQIEPLSTPCMLEVVIPFVNEITPNFVEGCSLTLGSQKVGTRIIRHGNGRALSADFHVQADMPYTLTLQTPPPMRPSDLRPESSDTRQLGIAILIDDRPNEPQRNDATRPDHLASSLALTERT